MSVLHFDLSTIANSQTARLALKLQAAEDVITYTRTALPHGAGNIVKNILSSNYLSYYLAGPGSNWLRDPNKNEWNQNIRKYLRTANITKYMGAGNCDTQATVTYSILRCLPRLFPTLNGVPISICTSAARLGGYGHTFAVIGRPTDPQDEVVVVDPWPTAPQPVLLSHHFCGGTNNNLAVLEWWVTKPADKNVDYRTRITKHQATLAGLGADAEKKRVTIESARVKNRVWLDVQMNAEGNPLHVFTNRITVNEDLLGADKVIYTTRKPWVSDDARTHCKKCKTKFGTFTRKHHCRRCGEIFCDKCSSHRNQVGLPATRPGEQPVAKTNGPERVCAACNNTITRKELDNSLYYHYPGGYVGR